MLGFLIEPGVGRRVLVALVGCMGLAAGQLSADTCTALQSGTWGPIDAGSATWDCADPGDDDRFVIPDAIEVTVVDDLIWDPGSSGGLTVESGGTLIARVVDRKLRISYSGAFDCRAGSSCELAGGYREFGVASPGVLPDQPAAGHLFVGDLVPCPGDSGAGVEPDCTASGTVRAGDPAVYRFSYPHDRYDAADGTPVDEHVAEAIAAIEPGEVICFFDPVPADPMAPVDDGYCYEITDREADPQADPAFVEIDVRQTDPAAPRPTAYPLALRGIGRTSVAADVLVGERSVDVPADTVEDLELYPGGVFIAERQYLSRWLRLGDGTGAAGDEAHKIVRVFDDVTCSQGGGTCDRLVIGDPRGLRSDHSAGDEIWLDYGWSMGDPFFVMVPLVIESATANPFDGRVFLLGNVEVEAVLVERTAGIDLVDSTVDNWKNVWIRDAAHISHSGNGNGMLVDGVTDALFGHTLFTGGNADLPLDRRHTVVTRRLTDVTFRDLAIRHHGDDCYTHATDATGTVMERVRCGFVALPAESCNLFGNATGATWTGTLRDVACEDCTSLTDAAPVIRPRAPGLTVDGLLVWGSGVRIDPELSASEIVNGPPVDTQFLDVLTVGSAPSLPWQVDGFVVRDAFGGADLRLFSADHETIANGIVHDVETSGTRLARSMNDGSLDNVLMYDLETTSPSCAGQCAVINEPAPAVGMTVRNLTLASTPEWTTSFDSLFGLPSPSLDYVDAVTFDGVLLTGMSASTGTGSAIEGSGDAATNFLNSIDNGGFGPCFWDNVEDVPPGAQLPASTLVGVDPGFVDPAAGRFDLLPGSPGDTAGCGALPGVEAPGLSRYRWLHAISGLVPERLADDPDGDGLPDDPQVATCSGGATVGCSDNCPAIFNPDQADTDADGIGDLCDDTCVGQQTVITRTNRRSAAPGRLLRVGATGIGATPAVLFGDKPGVLVSQLPDRVSVRVPNLAVGETFLVSLVNTEGCRSLNQIELNVTAPPQ